MIFFHFSRPFLFIKVYVNIGNVGEKAIGGSGKKRSLSEYWTNGNFYAITSSTLVYREIHSTFIVTEVALRLFKYVFPFLEIN